MTRQYFVLRKYFHINLTTIENINQPNNHTHIKKQNKIYIYRWWRFILSTNFPHNIFKEHFLTIVNILFPKNVFVYFFYQKNFNKNKRTKVQKPYIFEIMFYVLCFFLFHRRIFFRSLEHFILCFFFWYIFCCFKFFWLVFSYQKWCRKKKSIFKLTFCENITILHDTFWHMFLNINILFSIFQLLFSRIESHNNAF